jgi:dihydrofolate reductase
MGKIVVSDNVSLDGVIQDPAGDEGFRLGGWVGLIKDRQGINKLTLDEALGTQALLLGRRSYDWFAARWPSRSGELADRIDLVDELRLKIYPVVLGAGERFFGNTSDKKPMRLVGTQTVDGDVAFLTYERVRDDR